MTPLPIDRHNVLTESAEQTPVVFKTPQPQPAAPTPVRPLPQPTQPAKPTLFKPTGTPIPALTQIGYWGSIQDFNHAVQAAHDSYVTANGVRPDSKTLLTTALKTPVGPQHDPERLSRLPPIGAQDNAAILKQLTDIPKGAYDPASNQEAHKTFNDFMDQHGDTIQSLLNDPKTHAKALTAINNTLAGLDFHGVDGPGMSFGKAVRTLTTDPANYTGRTLWGLTKDIFQTEGVSTNLDHARSSKEIGFETRRNTAATFPNLTRVSPAVAQVVKGLVYSPAGVALALTAVSQDMWDAALYDRTNGRKGNLDFNRTRKMAKDFGVSVWHDINDPGGHAGYLILDAFGLISMGVGTAARLGRVGEAVSEASGLSAALREGGKALVKPHALQTVEYNKGGYTENISLSGNPFVAALQRHTPVIGTDAQVARVLNPFHDPSHEFSVADLMYNPIAAENRMGRAGSIRRATESKALSANSQIIEDAQGYAIKHTWMDRVIPDRWFPGLTKGEMFALQTEAWDVPGDIAAKLDARERDVKFLISQRMGDARAHQKNIALAGLARKAVENPSARYTTVLEALREASNKAEQMRLAYGMPDVVAATGLMKPGIFHDLADQAQATVDSIDDIFKAQPLEDGEELVYHGTSAAFKKYDTNNSVESNDLGRGIWVSPNAGTAAGYAGPYTFLRDYAQGGLVREENMAAIPKDKLIGPRVNMHRVDTTHLFDLREDNPVEIDPIKRKIEEILDPEQKKILKRIDKEVITHVSWRAANTGRKIHDVLSLLYRWEREGSHDDSAAFFADSQDFANQILEQLGFSGLKRDDREYMLFKASDLKNPYGEPPGMKDLEAKLHDLKAAMSALDVRYVPEGYTVPEMKPSSSLEREQKALDNMKARRDRYEAAETEFKKNLRARTRQVSKTGRDFSLDNKHRERVVKLNEAVDVQNEKVVAMERRERAKHLAAHPTKGLEPGYYVQVGSDWVPVNRQSKDSFYIPTLLKGKTVPFTRGLVRLPGSAFGMGKPGRDIWEEHQMTGSALIDGGLRTDTTTIVGQDYARTAKAIVTFNAYKKAWDAGREITEDAPLRPHEIPIRDVQEIPNELRKSLLQFYEGKLSAEEVASLPEDVSKHLFPKSPPPGAHVRAIDERMLGDVFFSQAQRSIAQAEPFFRMVMGPINMTLRPLILYNPKYILNMVGNAGMLVFDQGFVRSGQNLALSLSMKDWAIEDDHAVFKKLMGAGKASAYMSGEGHSLGAIGSQALADFWSRITDQDFRVASGIYYAKRAIGESPDAYVGESFAEKFHDLMTNPHHETVRNDVIKRGNDALVSFDRMAPFEKAVLRHVLFVYPWTRGAMIWSFRSVFEHPAKTSLLATLGQEAYTEDTWLKQAPEWMRRVGYIPFHWIGDKVSVIDPTSVNTWSILGDALGTMKAWREGDKYARASDMFGPAGQVVTHALTGVDSQGNVYKGSQLWGAVEDTLNMLPIVAAERRSAKGKGKAMRDYDVSSRTGLSTLLTSAMKTTALDPGWLSGYGNIFAGGFSPRELNLNAAAARYWLQATPKERHRHEVDLVMRQLWLQSEYLKNGKMPSDQEIGDMLLQSVNSFQVKGAVPEDVRQAVLDAGQIAYQGQLEAKKLGHSLGPKDQLLLALRYYRQAGRMDKETFNGLYRKAEGYSDLPDVKTLTSQVAVKYGHTKALYEWDRRVRVQTGFSNADTGKSNFDQRIRVLYSSGLAKQSGFNLADEERSSYSHIYTKYVTERDALKAKLSADDKLTSTQKSLQLAVFDSKHDTPVTIGGHTLPSVTSFGTGGNWEISTQDASTDIAKTRLALLVTKNWYHLSTAEKAMFGVRSTVANSEGWAAYWKTITDWRAGGYSITADARKAAADYVTTYYDKGFMTDWNYALKTPKITRFLKSEVYKNMPERDTFDIIAGYAKSYADGMASGNSSISGTRSTWKKYVNDSLMPWLEKDHPQLYAWLQPLGGASFLQPLINTG